MVLTQPAALSLASNQPLYTTAFTSAVIIALAVRGLQWRSMHTNFRYRTWWREESKSPKHWCLSHYWRGRSTEDDLVNETHFYHMFRYKLEINTRCRVLGSTFEKRSTYLGSPCWMAPEVIDCDFREGGSTYDIRIDVWALGKKENITTNTEQLRVFLHSKK